MLWLENWRAPLIILQGRHRFAQAEFSEWVCIAYVQNYVYNIGAFLNILHKAISMFSLIDWFIFRCFGEGYNVTVTSTITSGKYLAAPERFFRVD